MAFAQIDIVNSDNWDSENWKTFFKDRLNKMRSKRSAYDDKWKVYEEQIEAISTVDDYGHLKTNIPLEKGLKEVYMGTLDGKVNFDILPDGQTDIKQLQPAKYALDFFLDGNGKENFWKESRALLDLKSTYGSGIVYTGIRSYKDFRYEQKKDSQIQGDTDILNEANFEKIENETYFFFPKTIHPKDFYLDDGAYGNPDIQLAQDCIMKEKVSALELYTRYKGNTDISQAELEKVGSYTDIAEKNKESQSISQDEIVLFHYYHRITKKYMIVANEEQVLYNGLYFYNDGKLPFVNIQHYTNVNRFWGEGIPERVAYLKYYKSNILDSALLGAEMSNGIHLLTGNDDEIGQDWNFGGGGVNMLRSTGGVENVKQLNTSPNLGYFTNVLALIDQQITVDSGINPNAPFDPGTDKVGIIEVMEANKTIRNKSVDQNYNIGLDEALTMTLARIKQFAPSLLSEVIKSKDGKVLKTIFPKIKINDMKVEKDGKGQKFTEDLGKYGYFELKDDIVQGIGVKVTTPSTNSVLPLLERAKITDYINNFLTLAQAAQLDQTGKLMQELIKNFRFDELMKWNNDANQIDINGLKANTQKDEIAEENIAKMEEIQKILLSNTGENVENTNTPAPQNQGLGQPGGEAQGAIGGEQQPEVIV